MDPVVLTMAKDLATRTQVRGQQPLVSDLKSSSFNKAESRTNDLDNFTNHFMIKTFIPEASHFLSIIGNGVAAIANIFDFSKSTKKFADTFGYLGTKIFLILNGAINALEYFQKKNYLGAIGHSLDVFVGSFAPHDHVYLDRGNPVGTYTYANTLNIINGRDKFDSLQDHLQHLSSGLKKSFNNIFSRNFFANFKDVNKGMFGSISGVLCNVGAFIWHFTGQEKLATIVRDFGGFLVDLEQAHFGHLKEGRNFYFASGWGLIGGTISDFMAKMLPAYKKSLVPLSLAIDGVGRYLLRMAHNHGEITKMKSKPALAPMAA